MNLHSDARVRSSLSHLVCRCTGAAWSVSLLLGTLAAHAADDDIRLATIGYQPERPKVATVLGSAGATFAVKSTKDGAAVLTGTLSANVTDPDSKVSVRYADFSALRDTGSYYVEVEGVGRSLDFPVAVDVYRPQLVTAMLGFYGWRSGARVEFTHRDQAFKQGPGHRQDGLLDYLGQAGVLRDGSHGWYDAGDYGKYTINGAFTLGMMLKAWELFPDELKTLALPIPERGGTLPDFLDEAKWEYDWLATMQYSASDGRVSHKLTSLDFADFIMPEADVAPTYYSPFGSAAAADFVAAMALGSRVYRPYDAELADKMLAAAKLSYQWLRDNTADARPNISDFSTGAYTTTDADDRLWAAAEMWETTGDTAALAAFESGANQGNNPVDLDFDWGTLKNMGTYTYLLSTRSGKNATVYDNLKAKLVQRADTLVTNRNAHGYGRALTKYYWGVNGSVARTCMLLQVANRLQPSARYLDTCADQISYLYGRNVYNRSFITGEGKDPPLHPHHRPSASDGIERPFPGLLVGGSSTTATGWEDVEEDYEVNEVAVNWNGALVFALSGFATPSPDSASNGGNGGAGGAGGLPASVAGAAGTKGAVVTGGATGNISSALGGRTGQDRTASDSAASKGGAFTSSVRGGASSLMTGSSSTAAGGMSNQPITTAGNTLGGGTGKGSADTAGSDPTGGCGCRVASKATHSFADGILVLLALGAIGLRRRNQRQLMERRMPSANSVK